MTVPLSPRSKTVLYVVWLLATSLPGTYVLFVASRSWWVYRYVKSGYGGTVHRADTDLGYAAVPGARGVQNFPIGLPVPIQYDDEGFRIPAFESPSRSLKRPFVLALGCSYTFGAACPAEKTYPYLVAQRLGATSLNAGKNGYGLAQMMILARRLIPRYEPDFVLVQHSPWLLGRGLSGFARSTFGEVPVPYFAVGPGGSLVLQPPVFRSILFDLPIPRYDHPQASLGEFPSFVWNVGGPLFIHDDWNMLLYHWRRRTGQLPQRAPDPDLVVRLCYREISDLCRAHRSRMVIVHLSHPVDSMPPVLGGLQKEGRAVVVRAQAELNSRVPAGTKQAYQEMFAHWRGAPPALVDQHPNPLAHQIITDAIVDAIGRTGARDTPSAHAR